MKGWIWVISLGLGYDVIFIYRITPEIYIHIYFFSLNKNVLLNENGLEGTTIHSGSIRPCAITLMRYVVYVIGRMRREYMNPSDHVPSLWMRHVYVIESASKIIV